MRSALLLALVLSSAAHGAAWEMITEVDAQGSRVLLDTSSVVNVGKLTKAWFRWTYAEPKPIPNGVPKVDYKYTVYNESTTLVYFNCAERTSATVQGLYHDDAGTLVASFTSPAANAQYSEVAPETIGETMLEVVCGNRKS